MKHSRKTELVGKRLATLVDESFIVWSNGPTKQLPEGMYFSCQQVRVGTEDKTLAGGDKEDYGYFMISVVVDAGSHATAAEDKAQEIEALFPYCYRWDDPDGKFLLISEASQVLTGYGDGNSYRVPVKISYQSA